MEPVGTSPTDPQGQVDLGRCSDADRQRTGRDRLSHIRERSGALPIGDSGCAVNLLGDPGELFDRADLTASGRIDPGSLKGRDRSRR
jgi:hypothetical protein